MSIGGDSRHTWELITDILGVLENHGYHRGDDQHTGRAIALAGDLARIYEGTKEAPSGYGLHASSSDAAPSAHRAGGAGQQAITVGAADVRTILAALDEAADYKRDRAAGCADCEDQSCGSCQHRLSTADAYDGVTAWLQGAERASPSIPARGAQPASAESRAGGIQRQDSADREAGR
jgi:hypothetical protein